MSFVLRHKYTIIGLFAGAICGFLYYAYIGCASGNCAITSKPINSTLYGALLGGLLFNIFEKNNSEKEFEK